MRNAEAIYREACQRTGSDRQAYLDRACGENTALRREVEALLGDGGEPAAETPTVSIDADATAPAAGQREHVHRAMLSEQPGQMIGRYKLLERIGEGGFGTVWAAEQKVPVKRRVAIKIIKLGMDTKQVIARFEAERQALAMMDHPNIAKVLDGGSTEAGRPYFVMELVRGVPILDYCDTEKLHTRIRLELFIKVCHAIQHAHQKGIIHRDIKPTNVLVTLHDGKPVPKVIDFGIAKATNAELTEKTIYTQHRQMIGTPAYMSPEQAEMSGLDIDTRSDIYSLGVLLYELLTGTTPFANDELMSKGFAEMMRIIREIEPHRPSTRLSSLGKTATRTAEQRRIDIKRLGTMLQGDLDWIVMKCLEKDRTRRYDTANGLAMDIERHLADEPVMAGPPSASYKLRKFVKRNRGQVIAASVVAVTLILGVVGTSAGMMWALREKRRADGEATRANLAAQAEAEARSVAESNEQRAERELARAIEIKRLITEMLARIDPDTAKGADITLLKGILDDASARLSHGEVKDELIAAELHSVVGNVYESLGLYSEADQHLPVALDIRTRLLGPEHPATLDAMCFVAILRQDQARFVEAETLYRRALEAQQRVLGADDSRTLGTMTNLAILYRNQDRFDEAEPLCLQALETNRHSLGEEHPFTLIAMTNLAILYERQGQLEKAETLYLEALDLQTRALGEDNSQTLGTLTNLATLYRKQGRYAEAEPLTIRSLESNRHVLGNDHPFTLRAMSGLASLYNELQRYSEAEALYDDVLQARLRLLGPDHPDTLNARSDLANLYFNQGRFDEAETAYKQALEGRRRVLGRSHRNTLTTEQNLAAVYWIQQRFSEAESLFREVLSLKQREFGADDPATLDTMNTLAALLRNQGRVDEAEPYLEKVLKGRERVLGLEAPETLQTMSMLATSYEDNGRYAEAEALLLQTIELQKKVLGLENRSTLGTITNAGRFYFGRGRYEQAAIMYETSVPVMKRVLGMEDPWTGYAIRGLANSYLYLDRRGEALAQLQGLLEAEVVRAEARDADAGTLNSAARRLLTDEFEELRDPLRALGLAQRACAIEEAANGPKLAVYLDTLALAQHLTGDTNAAVATQQRAVDLQPDNAELQTTLAKYKAALAPDDGRSGEHPDH